MGLRATVLVVDDNTSIRRLVRKVLEKEGYRVIEAPTPAEARAHSEAEAGAIDVLITDFRMPIETGLSLAHALRSARPDLYVIIISGSHELPGEPIAGRSAFLPKPFHARELLEIVERAVDRSDAQGSEHIP